MSFVFLAHTALARGYVNIILRFRRGCKCLQLTDLVDAPKRGDINGLTTDGTGATDTGGVLTGAGVDDGVHQHLQGVLKREEGMR